MWESIIVFNKDGDQIGFQDRDIFALEQKKYFSEHWEVEFAAWSIGGFLLSRKGKIRLVKRWNTKESSFLYDKTVWWHMNPWENPHKTLRRELKEELGIKVKIAKNEDEFRHFSNTVDLTKRAVMMIMDHDKWLKVQVDPKNAWDLPYERRFNATIYCWIYEGDFSFDENEAIEWEDIWIEEVCETLTDNPKKYTKSLSDMMNRYKSRFKDICNLI